MRALLLAWFMLAWPASGNAVEAQFGGFVTQGFIKTDRNNYFGPSTTGSFDFREIGVSAALDFGDRVRLSTLLLSRIAGNTARGEPQFDHAVVDLKLSDSATSRTGILAGRVKLPIGLFNETRDVASTRPSILLPQSIYYDNARKYLINADGLILYHEIYGENSVTRITAKAMESTGINNVESETYFLGANFPGSIGSGTAYGLRVLHETDGGKTRLAAYAATNPVKYTPGSADILSSGDIKIKVLWLSAHREIGKWGFTAETMLPQLKYSNFGPVISDRTTYPMGLYGAVSYRSDSNWEAFARYDVTYIDRNDKSGAALSAATGKPAHAFFAKDVTIGGRYHFTPKTSLSAELHIVDGTAWVPIVDNPAGATDRYWKLFALQLTHSF